MTTFPIGTQYVANMDVLDRNPYTPKRFPVVGQIKQTAAGNTAIRAGFTHSDTDHRWEQTLHIVLTPAEREALIAELTKHRALPTTEQVDGKAPADPQATESVTAKPRQIEAMYVREGDEMPLFVGTDLPCGSENIARRDDDNIRWVRVNEIHDRNDGQTKEFRFDDGTSQEFGLDYFVVVRERVYLAN